MVNEDYKNKNVKNGLDLDKPMYKYIPLKYVIEMCKTKKLYMGKVKTWEDTYENFFLKQDFLCEGYHLSAKKLTDQIYGQSWTLINESDAMWRIYSNRKPIISVAIKVKTTPRRIFDAIYTKDECMATTFIGKVNYLYKKELVNWIKNVEIRKFDDFGKYVVPSMFMKRKPFLHEKEVRTIVFLDKDCGDYLLYDIDPDILFDEFVIDPRIDNNTTKKIIVELLKYVSDPKKVKQSSLYSLTPNVIKIG